MILRLFELYQQGRDFKSDPVGFGAGMGKEVIAPMFVIPIILLGLLSLGMIGLWWWIGWGIFMFLAFVVWFVLLGVHSVYTGMSRLLGDATSRIRTTITDVHRKNTTSESETIIIDVDARE